MVGVLALVAAVVVGVGDYLGGRASVTRPALVVTFVGQLTAAVLAVVAAVLVGWDALRPSDLVLGGASGVAAALATIGFFHALAHGRMSIVAPVTAATGVLVPVLVDLFGGTDLGRVTWVAMALVVAAIPMVAMRPGGDGSLPLRAELLLSVLAGCGYAMYFLLLGHTDESSGQWPVAASFVVGAAAIGIVVLARRAEVRPVPRAAVASGVCSVVAGVCIARALQIGPISLATVLGSLYPVITAGLAVRLDGERLRRLNVVGIVLAVGGAAVVAGTH